MVKNAQYPHVLQTKDDTGNWITVSVCRDQPNSKGEMIKAADGTYFQFDSLIYAPHGVALMLPNQDVRVIGEMMEKRLETSVKRFSSDSFHTRIWV